MEMQTVFSFILFLFFLLFIPPSAFSGWHVGSAREQVYRPGQRLRKSLQDRHQKGRAGARVLQVERERSTSRNKKVSRHTTLLLIFICVSVSTVCLVDLQSLT